jgi:hypothetical protein
MYCNPIEFHASSNLTHLVRQRSSQWRVRWEDLSLPHLFLLLRIKGGRLLVLSLNSELMTDQVCVRGLARTETFLHVSNLQTIIWRHVSHLTPSLYRPLPPSLSCSHARTHARTHTHTHTHTHNKQKICFHRVGRMHHHLRALLRADRVVAGRQFRMIVFRCLLARVTAHVCLSCDSTRIYGL